MRYTSRDGGGSDGKGLGVEEVGELEMPTSQKRYKSVFIFKCVGGHQNLLEDRTLANSPEEAQKLSHDRLLQKKCMYCNHTFNAVSTIGTEEISLYPQYWSLGYVCKCGERVTVFTEETGKSIGFPDEVTAQCSKGHLRKLLNHELPSLERWEEETN